MPADPDLSGKSVPSALGFILSLAGWRRLAILAILMTLAALSEGVGLLMLVPLAQSVVGGKTSFLGSWLPALPLTALLAIFVILVAARALLAYLNQNLQRDIGIDSIRRLRGAMRDAVMSAEWRWLAGQSGADHAALIMGMAEKIGYMAIQLLQLGAACTTLAILLCTAMALSWQLTVIVLFLGIGMVIPVALLRMRPVQDGLAYTEAYVRLQTVLQQGIAHLRAARIAGAGPALKSEFDGLAKNVGRIEKAHGRKVVAANLLFQVLAAVALAFVVWLSVEILSTPLPVLLPILAIFARAVTLSNTIQQGIRGWQFARPTIVSMQSLIADANAAAEPEAEIQDLPPLRKEMALRSVSFRFDDRNAPALANVDLVLRAGSITAVIGPSGSGKSTLADIASVLLEPEEGHVEIDGRLLRSEDRIAWRRRIAYVEQSPFLFDDTVRANLGWGRDDASSVQMKEALRAASAHFVLGLPEGLDTLVGETGRQLSGGERQRIALARALMRQPDLLILDETTSSLDPENEALIAHSLKALKGRHTILILGHRPAMTAIADAVFDLGSASA